MTGARFGRVDRRTKRAKPGKAPVAEPDVEPEEDDWDDAPAVGYTGARFARPPRKRRKARAAEEAQTAEPDDTYAPAPLVGPPTPPAFPAWDEADDSEPDDEEAGESAIRVRPYVLTGGRTQSRFPLPLEALVTTVPGAPTAHVAGAHLAVVQLCRASQSVAEVAARLGVPLGVARVLVDDLVASQAVTVYGSRDSAASVPDLALMERVLTGLRRL